MNVDKKSNKTLGFIFLCCMNVGNVCQNPLNIIFLCCMKVLDECGQKVQKTFRFNLSVLRECGKCGAILFSLCTIISVNECRNIISHCCMHVLYKWMWIVFSTFFLANYLFYSHIHLLLSIQIIGNNDALQQFWIQIWHNFKDKIWKNINNCSL